MIKRIFLVILLSISSFFLYASPETWIGLGFIASRNYIGSDAADYYNVYDLDGNLIVDGSDISNIRRIGGRAEIVVFPLSEVRVGFLFSGTIAFPVGYSHKDGQNESYFSRNLDFIFDGELGLAYYQLFGNFGFFIDAGMYYSYNRVAKENEKNYKENTTYDIFHEWGVWGEAGILSTFRNGYFRLGFKYNHDLCYSQMNFNIGLFVSGGYIIR